MVTLGLMLLLIDNQTEESLLRKIKPRMMLARVSKVNECVKSMNLLRFEIL